jgi:glycosyltransferase involved in cell wall biosynthesis
MSSPVVSFVIPSRGELMNLLWTLQHLYEHVDLPFEVVVVLNMPDEADVKRIERTWGFQEGSTRLYVYDQPSCWQSRNVGCRNALGEYICLLDSHVMFADTSVKEAVDYHRGWKGILAFGLNYWLDKPGRTLFQYDWKPERFWGTWTRRKPDPPDYRILMSGMNTLVDREVIEEIGGWHSGFGIYGGGEPYYYFKVQMYGYEARCHPAFQVHHLAEKRGYAWNNDDLWRNFMIAAYALGGDPYLDPLYRTYQGRCHGVERYLAKLDKLKAEAISLSEDEWKNNQHEAKLTLDQVIERWTS